MDHKLYMGVGVPGYRSARYECIHINLLCSSGILQASNQIKACSFMYLVTLTSCGQVVYL